jgi:hypothetical protein
MKTIYLLLILSLGACAEVGERPARPMSDDYQTGTNLPRRNSEATSLTREQIDEMQRSRPAPMGPGGH